MLAACTTEIAGGLTDTQAREVVAALTRAGVDAEHHGSGRSGYRVEVPAGERLRARAVLAAFGLPRERHGFATLYGRASLVPTPAEDLARYQDALGAELAGHVRELGGVLRASVVVSAPRPDPLAPTQPLPRPSASVIVTVVAPGIAPAIAPAGITPDIAPDIAPGEPRRTRAELTQAIQHLVAGAVSDLEPARVAVELTAELLPAAPALTRVGPVSVAASSAQRLRLLLAGMLVTMMAMAAWVIACERQKAALRNHLAQAQDPERRGISVQ